MEVPFRPRSIYSTITVSKHESPSNGSRDSQNENLENILSAAMEHGLYLMGEDFAQVTLYNLDRRYSLRRPEISRKPERFIEALRDMFGEGAQVIENFINQAICTEMGLNPDLFKRISLSCFVRKVRDPAAKKLKPLQESPVNETVRP